MRTAVELDHFGGIAPVQAWGKVEKHSFYFRARWNRWRFQIAKPGVDVPAPDADVVFSRAGDFLPGDFHEEAAEIIMQCFQDYFLEAQTNHAALLLDELNSRLQATLKSTAR